MANPELGVAFTAMTNDMSRKMYTYMQSLEQRYGDPRVYAQQREEMAAAEAEVMYSKAKTTEGVLSAAYNKNRQNIQDAHKAKRTRLSKHPQSAASTPDPVDRSGRPPSGPKPAPKAVKFASLEAAAR